jgi:glycosyltransferase involved in cell wall biosynthesis
VADGASALLIPHDDSDALKTAILKILNNNEAAIKMCKQNLKFAQKETWSIVAQAYEEAYLEILHT